MTRKGELTEIHRNEGGKRKTDSYVSDERGNQESEKAMERGKTIRTQTVELQMDLK